MKITFYDKLDYTIKFQLAFILVLLLVILVISAAPTHNVHQSALSSFNDHVITFDFIDRTTQQSLPPAPTRPRLSLILTQDFSIEDPDFLPFLDIPIISDVALVELPGSTKADTAVSEQPQRPPRVTRIVEPVTPQGVIEDNLRVEITITFLINPDGTIDELFVSEIRVLDRQRGLYIEASSVGHQVIEATIEAARQWQFRPATDNGVPVKAYSSHVFIVGR